MSMRPIRIDAPATADQALEKAFRKARRHTALVKFLRIILPSASVVLLATYGISFEREFRIKDGVLKVESFKYSSEILTAENPKYEGYNQDGSKYFVTAKLAEQDIKQTKPIKLTTISGTMTDGPGTITKLDADHGFYNTKNKILDLRKKVQVRSTNNMSADLTQAIVYTDKSRIVSNQPVLVTMPSGTVRGNRMNLEQKIRLVTFDNGVKTRLRPASEAAARSTSPSHAQTDERAAQPQQFGDPTKPTDIDSSKLVIDDKAKSATFSGKVRAVQADSSLEAPELIVHYENDDKANQSVPAEPGNAGRIKSILAREDVILHQTDSRVTAKIAEFHPVERKARLLGSVVVESRDNSRATGDQADIDTAEDTALLTGNVVVTQDKNELRGRRLLINRKVGSALLTSPSEDGGPAAPISARLYQNANNDPAKAATKKKPKNTEGEGANTSEKASFQTFKTNPEAPIDILANRFESNDRTRKAVFSGNVRAKQGNIDLKSKRLVASYTGGTLAGASLPAKGATPATRITTIRAEEAIEITSGPDQKATGDWADFDTVANTVTIGGKVTLIRGQQVIRGPKLIIDLTTGVGRMDTGQRPKPPSPPETTGVFAPGPGLLPNPRHRPQMPRLEQSPTASTECPPGRMCMLLYRNDPAAKPLPKQQRPATTSSGWSTTNTPPP